MKKLTKKQFELLWYHTRANMSWGEGGSFNKGKNFDETDTQAIKEMYKILDKIKEHFVN